MLSQADVDAWGERLANARHTARATRTDAGPPPEDLADAYRIQTAAARHLGAIRGFKISALTREAQAKAGVDRIFAGALLAPYCVASGATLERSSLITPILECEYAFELTRPLPRRSAPYSRAEVEQAIGALVIVIEIPDSRFATPPSTLLSVADFVNNGAFITGPRIADWRSVDYLHTPIVLTVDGREIARGSAAPILNGDPVGAVAGFANAQPDDITGLEAGMILTTGSCTGAPPMGEARELVADFGALGKVRATIA